MAGTVAMASALTADIYGRLSVGSVFGTMFLVHQVGGGVADERIAAELRGEVVAAVDDGAAGGGAGGEATVLAEDPLLVAAVHPRVDAGRPDELILRDLDVHAAERRE